MSLPTSRAALHLIFRKLQIASYQLQPGKNTSLAKHLDLPLWESSFRYNSSKAKCNLKVEIIERRQVSLRLLARQTTARFRFLAAVGSLNAALLNGGTAALVLSAALQPLVTAAEFHIRHAAGRLIRTASELFGAAAFWLVSRLGLLGNQFHGTATSSLGDDGLRGAAAGFRFLAAGQPFRATLLNGGTTAFVLRAALRPVSQHPSALPTLAARRPL